LSSPGIPNKLRTNSEQIKNRLEKQRTNSEQLRTNSEQMKNGLEQTAIKLVFTLGLNAQAKRHEKSPLV
jgi:hypothetical protein